MKKIIFITTLVTLFLSAQTIFAKTASWELDKAHSNFYFSIDHIFSTVNGHFQEYSSAISFDPNKLDQSKFVFEIMVDSLTTHNSKRDKHLLSSDFFNESKFPSIRFESSKVTAAGDNIFNIEGIFTIKGKEYPLTLPLTLVGVKDHPMVKKTKVAGFNGKIIIDRLAYGVGTGKFLEYGVVGKDVEIFVSLEALSKD